MEDAPRSPAAITVPVAWGGMDAFGHVLDYTRGVAVTLDDELRGRIAAPASSR